MTTGPNRYAEAGDGRTELRRLSAGVRSIAPAMNLDLVHVESTFQDRLIIEVPSSTSIRDVSTSGQDRLEDALSLVRSVQQAYIEGLGLRAEMDRQIEESKTRAATERVRTIERIVQLLGLQIADPTSQRLVREALEQVAREEVTGP